MVITTGNLLVLGGPGAGKTTALLRLAQALFDMAAYDETCRLPLILNLSTWRPRHATLVDWLVEELNAGFAIPAPLVRTWLPAGRFALLLDGLDEVPKQHRATCVAAIDDFRRAIITPVAVCTRTEPYLALGRKLALEGAVELQDLNDAYVARRLDGVPGGDALQALAGRDPVIRALTRSPLFLGIMIEIVEPLLADTVRTGDFEHQQREILRLYAETMQLRRPSHHFSHANTRRWLGQLARMMCSTGTSECRIERIQPSWLPCKSHRAAFVSLSLLFVSLASYLSAKLSHPVFAGLAELYIAATGAAVSPADEPSRTFRVMIYLLGAFITLPVPLALLLRGRLLTISMHDRMAWSWRAWWSRFTHTFALVFIFLGCIAGGLPPIKSGIPLSLFIAALLSPSGGLVPATGVDSRDCRPWPITILRSAGLSAIVAFIPFAGLAAVVPWIDATHPRTTFTLTLLIGLFVAHIVLYLRGGYALLQHIVLRFLLADAEVLPWRLRTFLDEGVELQILRRVGAGYMFIHHLLQESLSIVVTPRFPPATNR